MPKRVARDLAGNGSRRVICTINGSESFQRALIPLRDGMVVVTVNKDLQKSLGLTLGSRVRVTLRRDRSRYGLPLPDELAELLRQDPEGDVCFKI